MEQHALTLQPETMPVYPDVGAWDELGLIGVIAFLLVKEGASWFRAKEAAEDQLVATLVADLRATQKDLLEKLFELHNRQHEDLTAVRSELEGIREQLETMARDR
ncbi:MAG: hypothetical protein F6J95_023825 [Leptolyngbya sp. SIO1E4]|nr:hypothetical protein [Leptolyngbya sp. SIO1E4]